jgi:hypothetical protein
MHQLAVSPDEASAGLKKIRVGMVDRFGRALNKIKIRGVLVRKVTGTSGEAEVQYNLRLPLLAMTTGLASSCTTVDGRLRTVTSQSAVPLSPRPTTAPCRCPRPNCRSACCGSGNLYGCLIFWCVAPVPLMRLP